MTTTTLGSPAFPTALGAEAIPRANDIGPFLKKLFQSMLDEGRNSIKFALDAMRALWRWICALINRIARALGFKSDAPQDLTQNQLTGDDPTAVGVSPDALSGSAPVVEGAAATAAVFSEVEKLVEYLCSKPFDPKILANPDTAHEFLRFHAAQLGQYHATFVEMATGLERDISARCAEIAQMAGTTAAVIRSQLESPAGRALYDKEGVTTHMFEQAKEVQLAKGRIELAVASLMDATSHPTAQPGMREHALSLFTQHMPGVQFDRAPPPSGDVAAASGETSAIAGDEVAHVPADVQPAASEAGAVPLENEGSFARSGISAKSTLEFGPLAQQATRGLKSPTDAGLRLVQGTVAPPVSDEMKQEAILSPFAGKGFANLQNIANRRRENDKTDWGDALSER